MGSGWTAASVPPATAMSARPLRIISAAYPMASRPEAHAETGVCAPGAGAELERHGRGRGVGHEHRDSEREDPARPLLLEDVPLGQQGPDAADARAHARASRSGSTSGAPACAQASREAISAYCALGSRRRTSTLDSTSVGGVWIVAAKLHRQLVLLHPVVVHGPGARAPGEDRLPRLGDRASHGGGGAQSGDDNASLLGHGWMCSFIAWWGRVVPGGGGQAGGMPPGRHRVRGDLVRRESRVSPGSWR